LLSTEQVEPKIGLDQLVQERAKFLMEQLIGVIPYVKELTGITDEARKVVEQQVAEFALSIKTSKLDRDQLEAFFKKPYYLEPVHGRPDSWHLVIPKFVDIQIGWLERSTECYDESTRVLTREGFKFFKDLTFNDEILTLNNISRRMEYQKPTKLYTYDYDGFLVHFKGESINLLVTPDHYVFAGKKGRTMRGFKLLPAKTFLNCVDKSFCFARTGGTWRGRLCLRGIHGLQATSTSIPLVNCQSGGTLKNISHISLETFIPFFGWWITEGSYYIAQAPSAGYKQYKVLFANQNDSVLEEYASLVHAIGFSPTYHRNPKAKGVEFSSKQICLYLKQFGHARDKSIPIWIKNLPTQYLQTLFNVMMRGDGHIREGKPHTYTSSSKRLAEDFAEIALKLGYGASISLGKHGLFRVGISTRKLTPTMKTPELVQYIGKVHCAAVPNHIMMVEREGKICWSGNSFNVFLINRYMDWLGEIPEAIKRQLNWKAPPELILDGEELHGPKGALEYAWQKYRPFLHDRDENKIRVNPKRAFDLIASMIKDGVLPFSIKPVDNADLVDRKCEYSLRDYQVQAWNELKRFSAIGVYFPPNTGKTIIGLWAMTHLKPPHLIVVPTRLLQEQWLERIQAHTDLQPGEYEVLTYQGAIRKASGKQWTILIVDEAHHLPANSFIKLSFLRRKYTLGLSACIASDTEIRVNDGLEIASELVSKETKVYGVERQTMIMETQSAEAFPARWLGNKQPFLVTTNRHSIKCTGDHPFLAWVWKKGYVGGETRYIRARHLENGTLVATATLSPLERNSELIQLLGFCYGDGHIKPGSGYYRTTFTGDEGEAGELQKTLDRLGFSSRKAKKGDKEAYSVEVHGTVIGRTFVEYGASMGRKTTQITEVPSLDGLKQKRLFISGLFGAEGHPPQIRKRMPHYHGDMIDWPSMTLTTEKIKHLAGFFDFIITTLTEMGIETKFKITERKWISPKGRLVERYVFTVFIKSNTENLIKFLENIEFAYSPSKQALANSALAWLYARRRALSLRQSFRISRASQRTCTPFTPTTQLRNKSFTTPPTSAYIRWEAVNASKRLESKFPIIDIRAPLTENFIAGGFVTHNTPFREDGREEYVFALSGKPVGLSWDYFKKLGLIKSPTCHVWIMKNFEAKLRRLDSLLQTDMRTIIFSDSIEVGKTVAARFSKPDAKVPFVYGATKDNLETILAHRVVVVSRVGDEGMSLPNIERVIEVSWLFGSRRQELQRTTRLLHSQREEQEHHILMTLEEYLHDRKRLFSIMDKGFKIVLHREGVSEKVIEDHSQDFRPLARPRQPISKQASALEPVTATPSLSVSPGQSGTYTNLPGVQRIMALMNKKEKQLYTLLLDHDGEWFSGNKLPFLLGYASKHSMQVSLSFKKMVDRDWIEQQRIEGSLSYRTNMKGKLGGG
jgi:superfamily II DNA or RNA helicase